jgi:NADH-ubiquinone oxidoreductase chain 4
MLTRLLLVPLLGVTLILIREDHRVEYMKKVALFRGVINFLISIVLWREFDSNALGYQFVQEFNHVDFCHFHIGVDGISLYFVLLTTFLTPLCLLGNWDNLAKGYRNFLIAFLLLETLLIAVFVVLDLMLFYIFFESVLIPMFLVIGVWGSGRTSIRASFLMFLYTLAGSLFMLLAILEIYNNVGTTDFTVLSLDNINFNDQKVLWLAIFLAFAIKTPLRPFHMWLPRAHAEAPLAGSMLLAGVFLKLATYGFLRVLINFLPQATNYFSPLVQTIAVVTLIYSSLATIRQSDFKRLVAYSSISHMAVVVLGLFSNTIMGIEGAILLSLAHGFISPAMFRLVGSILYDRTHTRVIRYYRGRAVYMPVFAFLFFMATIANMGIPLSLNFAGEVLSLAGIFQRTPVIAVFRATGIVFSACYSIFLFNRVRFGKHSNYLGQLFDVNRREFVLIFSLLLPAFRLGLCPNVVLTDLHIAVTELLYT